jgi:hypothetical protein
MTLSVIQHCLATESVAEKNEGTAMILGALFLAFLLGMVAAALLQSLVDR